MVNGQSVPPASDAMDRKWATQPQNITFRAGPHGPHAIPIKPDHPIKSSTHLTIPATPGLSILPPRENRLLFARPPSSSAVPRIRPVHFSYLPRKDLSMSQADFLEMQPLFSAITGDALKKPNIPMPIFLQEAENLLVAATHDKDALLEAGFDVLWLESMPAKIGALNQAESI